MKNLLIHIELKAKTKIDHLRIYLKIPSFTLDTLKMLVLIIFCKKNIWNKEIL